MVPLKIVSNVSRFKPALNLNRVLADLNRGSNSLNSATGYPKIPSAKSLHFWFTAWSSLFDIPAFYGSIQIFLLISSQNFDISWLLIGCLVPTINWSRYSQFLRFQLKLHISNDQQTLFSSFGSLGWWCCNTISPWTGIGSLVVCPQLALAA